MKTSHDETRSEEVTTLSVCVQLLEPDRRKVFSSHAEGDRPSTATEIWRQFCCFVMNINNPDCVVMSQVEGQVTPVNLPSSRGLSTPGSPAAGITVNTHRTCSYTQCVHRHTHLLPVCVCVCVCVQARVNDQVVGYRDLAALPRDKAILQVERPDLMTYQPHLSFSPLDPPRREVTTHLCCLYRLSLSHWERSRSISDVQPETLNSGCYWASRRLCSLFRY